MNRAPENRINWIGQFLLIGLSVLLTVWLLLSMLCMDSSRTGGSPVDVDLMEDLDRHLSNHISIALSGVTDVERVYQLRDGDLVAPKPDPENFGETEDPARLSRLLEEAASVMKGQNALFTPQTQIKEGSKVQYYLDETIFALTWKQVVDDSVYTFCEVKVVHPSQFRRFLSEGAYGSGVLHTTTEMSESVNAVVASSGDYYGYRSIGIVINNGRIFRDRGHLLDTCYIDDKGDMLFNYAGEIVDEATAQKFVEENNVRFSLSFGPVMIRDGDCCVPNTYNSGEINGDYARSALCQLGELHYAVVVANTENPHLCVPTVREFACNLQEMGISTAYALDGGQTAAIAMNNQLINKVSYGAQREISDIIYFATALPENR